MQIYAPLNYFGSYYRQIQRNMIDMENMFELLGEAGTVADSPDAVRFELKRGAIEFWDVGFSYTADRTILSRVSFCVRPAPLPLRLSVACTVSRRVCMLCASRQVTGHLANWAPRSAARVCLGYGQNMPYSQLLHRTHHLHADVRLSMTA